MNYRHFESSITLFSITDPKVRKNVGGKINYCMKQTNAYKHISIILTTIAWHRYNTTII